MIKLARSKGLAPGRVVAMRAYRALLHVYPASFRSEYGEEMCGIFRRRRLAAAGPFAIAGLWISATLEVLGNAMAVHWEILRQDLRYTVRTLSRARGFALTTIVLVAIGVGANTAAFSVTDFVLVRPLPYPDSSSLVRAWQEEVGGYSSMEFSPANYRDWRRLTQSFERTGAFYTSAVNVWRAESRSGSTWRPLPPISCPRWAFNRRWAGCSRRPTTRRGRRAR